MILYATKNRALEVWYLDLTGALARPPVSPAVYALVSFERGGPRYYVGSSRRLTARLGAHFSFARSRKLRGNSAGGQFLGPVLARRRRVLVIVLETCAGAGTRALQRCEQAWIISARRDNGIAALPWQIPDTTAPTRGPHAPVTLAERRAWPTEWVQALAGFFLEPRRAPRSSESLRRALNGNGRAQHEDKAGVRRRRRPGTSAETIAAERRR